MFFNSAPRFLAKQFQLHALSSRKNDGVVRASKEVLHELQFFVELLHGRVCGAEFVQQRQTPLYTYDKDTNSLFPTHVYVVYAFICLGNLPIHVMHAAHHTQDRIGTCKLYLSMIEMNRPEGRYRDVPAQTTHLDVLYYFFLRPTANFLIQMMIMNNQLNRERLSTAYIYTAPSIESS